MSELARFGVSMEDKLLARFDRICERKGYANRSEAIRDLIRDLIVSEEWKDAPASDVVGTLALVYDHHTRELQDKLTEVQHRDHASVVSSLHVHLDHHNCLEVLVLRGHAGRVRKLADRMIATRGVKHGKLITTTTGKGLV